MASAQDLPRYLPIIDGEECEPDGGEFEPVTDPATGNCIAMVSVGNETDLDQAVSAAKKAFDNSGWRNIIPTERSRILFECGRLIKENAMELAGLEISSSGGTVNRVVSVWFRFYRRYYPKAW